MQRKIIFGMVAVILLGIGFGAGYWGSTRHFANEYRRYSEYREATERELGELRGALSDAQVRSDTAIRGLDEAIRGLGAIKDRNQRIIYLIDTIRATVSQLRAIYDRTSQAISTDGTEP